MPKKTRAVADEDTPSAANGGTTEDTAQQAVLDNVLTVVRRCLAKLKAGELINADLDAECYDQLTPATAQDDSGQEKMTKVFKTFLGTVADALASESAESLGGTGTDEQVVKKKMRKKWMKVLKEQFVAIEAEVAEVKKDMMASPEGSRERATTGTANRKRAAEPDEQKQSVRAKRQKREGGAAAAAAMKQETDDEGEDDSPREHGTVAMKQETDDEKDDEGETMNEVLVEFKFRSCKTYLVKAGQWEGVLQVPMLQDAKTGLFSLPMGDTKFHGKVARDRLYPDPRSIWGNIRGDGTRVEQSFEGHFSKSDATTTFDLGMNLIANVFLDVYERIEPAGPATVAEEEKDGDGEVIVSPFVSRSNQEQLDRWVKNQGGLLCAYAHAEFDDSHMDEYDSEDGIKSVATYKLKLYTVLSVHRPNQVPSKPEKGYRPDWTILEEVVFARFPLKGVQWSRRAVLQYRLFLDLKIANEDWDSSKFSPSGPIDEVWHAHISFLDRYQRDIFFLTGNEHLIEHSPVLGKEASAHYKDAYKAHVEKMRRAKEPVDADFWPSPQDDDSEENEGSESDGSGDSYDHLDNGYAPNCG
mmetsp:Transcript_19528/g.42492  ORF Transcript_19528/g.42492 Transcript_19528/m.42492 type:complete len:585 (+) Transcript_19528:271-2025(+)